MMEVLKVLDLLLVAAELGLNIKDRAADIRDRLRPMIEEGRDPTPEEWADLIDRSALADEIIERIAQEARNAGS